MHIQSIPLENLIPYARNPRKNEAAVDKVAASLKEFGWQQPIVVDKENVIVAGHTRLLAAKRLKLSEAPVVVAEDLTPAQIKAYRLADNRSHEDATWDDDLLALELGDLDNVDFPSSLTGFDEAEIKQLTETLGNLKNLNTDAEACPDIAEATVSEPGMCWHLSPHRLLCGDATKPEDLKKLMQDKQADMVFTDPPYNVDYQGSNDKKLKMAQDNIDPTKFSAFLNQAFAACVPVINPQASLYVFHGWRTQLEFQQALEANGFHIRNQIIWAKQHFSLRWGNGRYKMKHEPMFYAHLQGQTDRWFGEETQTTLWEIDKPARNRLHPTMKPVALVERALQNSSQAGEIILDPFAGAGSTLMACENQNRQARLMEIEPKYVDVIIRRWQTYTGQQARLDGGAQRFDDLVKV